LTLGKIYAILNGFISQDNFHMNLRERAQKFTSKAAEVLNTEVKLPSINTFKNAIIAGVTLATALNINLAEVKAEQVNTTLLATTTEQNQNVDSVANVENQILTQTPDVQSTPELKNLEIKTTPNVAQRLRELRDQRNEEMKKKNNTQMSDVAQSTFPPLAEVSTKVDGGGSVSNNSTLPPAGDSKTILQTPPTNASFDLENKNTTSYQSEDLAQYLAKRPKKTVETPKPQTKKTEIQKKSDEAYSQYHQALTQGLPNLQTPPNIPAGEFNPAQKHTTSASISADSANGLYTTFTQTNIKKTVIGTNQEKKQIVTYVAGNSTNVSRIGSGSITEGVINTTTNTDHLTFQQQIPGGGNLPEIKTGQNYNRTIKAEVVQVTNTNIEVQLNGKKFSSDSIPKTGLDAFQSAAVGGNLMQIFPSNAPKGQRFTVGAPVVADLAQGQITSQPGLVLASQLIDNQQKYFENAFFWKLGNNTKSALRPISETKINEYSVSSGKFESANVIKFDEKGNARSTSSFRQFNAQNLVVNTSLDSLNVDLKTTAKKYLASIPGLTPLNPKVITAVNAAQENTKTVANPNDLTVKFKQPGASKNSGVSLASLDRAAGNIRRQNLPNLSLNEVNISASGNSYSGYAVQAGEFHSSYDISKFSTANEVKNNPVVSKLVSPQVRPLSNVYTILTETDNLTGESVTNKYNLPTSMHGGFGSATTTQTSKKDYIQSQYKGVDINPALRVVGTLGNQKSSLTGSATLAVNPFAGSLPGGVKESTPTVVGELKIAATHNINKNFGLRLNGKFSTDPRPDNPQTISALATFQAKNVAATMGAVYLNGGVNTAPVVLPVVNASANLGKTSIEAGIVGTNWNAEVRRRLSKKLGVGVYMQNSPRTIGANTDRNNQTQNQLNFGVVGEYQINKNLGVSGYVGNNEYGATVKYENRF
jgi:hypothetical protein